MLTLYHNEMSVCAQKVRIVLAEKNIDWESIHLNLFDGEARTATYKKLNPNGVVPTLVTENGDVVIESTIIMEYLDDISLDHPLKPRDPLLTAAARMWARKIDDWVHTDTTIVSNAVAFRFRHLEGKSEEEVKKHYDAIPDEARRELLWDLATHGTGSHFFSGAMLRFQALFEEMDNALKKNNWLVGDDYSIADIAFTPYLTRFDHLNMMSLFNTTPSLLRWYEEVRERSSYSLAIKNWLDHDLVTFMAEKGKEALADTMRILNRS